VETDRSTYGLQDTVRLTVRFSNGGGREGVPAAEVLQFFSQDSVASITPAVDQLRAWRRVEVQPGAQGEIEMAIPVQSLGFINRDNEYVVEPGVFGLRVNGHPPVAIEVVGESKKP
jgi:beta-glucosidase